MRAVLLTAVDQLEIAALPDPAPGPGEVRVALRAAALNHRDVWIKKGRYGGVRFPVVPGSDGAGVVEALGESADASWLGREVIVNPAFDWGPNPNAQGPGFSILGLPRPGTFSEKIVVPLSQLCAKPTALSWAQAAALPLAGLTAWRALFSRARLEPGERVLINGIGGGVALFALQFAVAAGAETWVTSSSEDKIARAVALGAQGGSLYTRSGWAAQTAGFDVIIDGAGGEGLAELVDAATPGARIVVYGATRGDPTGLALRKLFWRQISILGSTMGSPTDWAGMTAFVDRHRIDPIVSHTFPLERASEAFALMEGEGQFGKVVIQLA